MEPHLDKMLSLLHLERAKCEEMQVVLQHGLFQSVLNPSDCVLRKTHALIKEAWNEALSTASCAAQPSQTATHRFSHLLKAPFWAVWLVEILSTLFLAVANGLRDVQTAARATVSLSTANCTVCFQMTSLVRSPLLWSQWQSSSCP